MPVEYMTIWDVLGSDPGPMPKPPTGREVYAARIVAEEAAAKIETTPATGSTAEEAKAIEDFAISEALTGAGFDAGASWREWIEFKAITTILPGPLLSQKQHAQIRLTETRIGWTSGYDYETRANRTGSGGQLRPNVDEVGWYVWSTRVSALHEAGHELYRELLKDDPNAAHEVREYLIKQGVCFKSSPDGTLQRRLVSRARVAEIKAGPPFRLHANNAKAVDIYLGPVSCDEAEVLLWRRVDPDICDGSLVGGRYVLMRFRGDPETPKLIWSMPVDGDGDEAIQIAIMKTIDAYRWHGGVPASE